MWSVSKQLKLGNSLGQYDIPTRARLCCPFASCFSLHQGLQIGIDFGHLSGESINKSWSMASHQITMVTRRRRTDVAHPPRGYSDNGVHKWRYELRIPCSLKWEPRGERSNGLHEHILLAVPGWVRAELAG